MISLAVCEIAAYIMLEFEAGRSKRGQNKCLPWTRSHSISQPYKFKNNCFCCCRACNHSTAVMHGVCFYYRQLKRYQTVILSKMKCVLGNGPRQDMVYCRTLSYLPKLSYTFHSVAIKQFMLVSLQSIACRKYNIWWYRIESSFFQELNC